MGENKELAPNLLTKRHFYQVQRILKKNQFFRNKTTKLIVYLLNY